MPSCTPCQVLGEIRCLAKKQFSGVILVHFLTQTAKIIWKGESVNCLYTRCCTAIIKLFCNFIPKLGGCFDRNADISAVGVQQNTFYQVDFITNHSFSYRLMFADTSAVCLSRYHFVCIGFYLCVHAFVCPPLVLLFYQTGNYRKAGRNTWHVYPSVCTSVFLSICPTVNL